jgi:hypothetical protein
LRLAGGASLALWRKAAHAACLVPKLGLGTHLIPKLILATVSVPKCNLGTSRKLTADS